MGFSPELCLSSLSRVTRAQLVWFHFSPNCSLARRRQNHRRIWKVDLKQPVVQAPGLRLAFAIWKLSDLGDELAGAGEQGSLGKVVTFSGKNSAPSVTLPPRCYS